MARKELFPRITIHTDYYYRRFLARKCSFGYCFSVSITLLVLIIPFVTTFFTGYFWPTSDISQENPIIEFKNKIYTELLFLDPTDGTLYDEALHTYEYSTVKSVRDKAQNQLAPPAILSTAIENDGDGNFEQWNITMKIRKPEPYFKLVKGTFIAAFDYQTNSNVLMQMETLLRADVEVPQRMSPKVNADKINLWGSLKLKQQAIQAKGVQYWMKQDYNDDIFNRLAYQNVDQFYTEYLNRNETTYYEYQKMIQYSELAQQSDDVATSNFIMVEMLVKVPRTESVSYVPQLAQVLKIGWMQYFYVFLFWYYLLYKGLLCYLVTNRVFESIDVHDLNVKHIREEK